MGINGVAMAMNIVFFAYSTFIIIFVAHHYKNSFLDSMRYLIKIYIPFFYLLLVLLGFIYFKHININRINDNITQVLIMQMILVVVPFGYIV